MNEWDYCPNCGNDMVGDGYLVVRHCPNADPALVDCAEPDAPAIHCTGNPEEIE